MLCLLSALPAGGRGERTEWRRTPRCSPRIGADLGVGVTILASVKTGLTQVSGGVGLTVGTGFHVMQPWIRPTSMSW